MKGQVSIEFLAYFGITMIALAVMYTAVADRQVEALDYREDSKASNIASKIAFEVEQASEAGDGYSREIELPREIFGDEYEVSTVGGFVEVEWEGKNVVEPMRAEAEIDIESSEFPAEVENDGGDISIG